MRHLLTFIVCVMALSDLHAEIVGDTLFDRAKYENTFAFGADVSFVPMMGNTKWLDKYGKQKDILQILKETGVNAIRLRVWTVKSGSSSKQEVVDMCKRAKAKGLDVMIDFHYSDTWADPGNQTIPSAWTDHSVEALSKNLYDHTVDVLKACVATGANVRWVQVGNETKRGMLYPVGQTNKGGSEAFAKFVQSGYDAVKSVDPNIQVIVHLDSGHDNSLYRSIFDGLKKNGAKWDIIGLSAYMRWSHLGCNDMLAAVMSNIQDLKKRYGTPCMVVETGHYPDERALEGNQYLSQLMYRMIKDKDMTGVFYWEPEMIGGNGMGAWDPNTMRPSIMMDAFLGVKYTEVKWVMKANMLAPLAEQALKIDEPVTFEADVQHIRKRSADVTFFVDGAKKGVVKASPYQLEVKGLKVGTHRVWANAVDAEGHEQGTDTVTFFIGESAVMNAPQLTADSVMGGTADWKIYFKEAGDYSLQFHYYTDKFKGTELHMDGDSIDRVYFNKKGDNYLNSDICVDAPGTYTIRLVATGLYGLPTFHELRIFPLNGQSLPVDYDPTGISTIALTYDGPIEVYTLSGSKVSRRSVGLLKLPHGWDGRPCVVNCVGGTPYIVRKQRLK